MRSNKVTPHHKGCEINPIQTNTSFLMPINWTLNFELECVPLYRTPTLLHPPEFFVSLSLSYLGTELAPGFYLLGVIEAYLF